MLWLAVTSFPLKAVLVGSLSDSLVLFQSPRIGDRFIHIWESYPATTSCPFSLNPQPRFIKHGYPMSLRTAVFVCCRFLFPVINLWNKSRHFLAVFLTRVCTRASQLLHSCMWPAVSLASFTYGDRLSRSALLLCPWSFDSQYDYMGFSVAAPLSNRRWPSRFFKKLFSLSNVSF